MSWVLSWKPASGEAPEVLGSETVEAASIPSGGFVLLDGYLFDNLDVAAAYGQNGIAALEVLRGAFLIAVWDAGAKRVFAQRDHTGIQPGYYFWKNGLFLLSSSLDAILGQPEVSRDFNRAVIAEQLIGKWPLHQARETSYEEVLRLEPAHWLTIESGGDLRIERYWDAVPPGFAWATQAELSDFPRLAERAVARCLSAGADSLALSGGFDSVSIAALAAPLTTAQPLHAVSLRFTDTVCDEGDTQTAVAKAFRMPLVIESIHSALGGEAVEDAALAFSAHSPGPVLNVFQGLYTGLLRSAQREGLSRLMMGTGGDELFGVDLAYGADCFAAGDFAGLWRFYRMWQRTSPFPAIRIARLVLWEAAIVPEGKRVLRQVLQRTLPSVEHFIVSRRAGRPAWRNIPDPILRSRLEERGVESPTLPIAAGERSYVRALRGFTRSPLWFFEQEQIAAWASHYGFRIHFPYFDADLVGIVLRTHPDHLMAGGWSKAPLRKLVADRLPGVPLRRKKVDFSQIADHVFRPAVPRVWSSLGGAVHLSRLGVIERKRADSLVELYIREGFRHLPAAWRVISAEAWLQARSQLARDSGTIPASLRKSGGPGHEVDA